MPSVAEQSSSQQSLQLEADHRQLYNGRVASKSLRILIVGCGLGGLAAAYCLSEAGHDVVLIEAAKKLGEVGAGIQVSPNVARLLRRWGLGEKLKEMAVMPESIVFRRYSTGQCVGYSRWGDGMEREHGAPYYHIHRADFHRMVYDLAIASPMVTLRLGSTVKSVEPSPKLNGAVSVTLASGEVISGDLLIGADGVKSIVRQVVVGRPDHAEPTGDAAYRAIISTDVMLKDPDLKQFVETPEMTAWMGPGRHLMAYCIRGKKEYNLVMLHPDDGSVESWTAEGSAEKMREDFDDFEPRVRKLLSHVQSTLKWRLMDRKPLETWVHPEGRVVLLGDSCHPMLPYRAQGAAMALEDAAVLGNLLSHISAIEQLPVFLRAYEKLRHKRASKTQASSRLNQHIFHLPDGPEQEARDASMRDAMHHELLRLRAEKNGSGLRFPVGVEFLEGGNDGNANQWADRKKSIEQFSYDADAVAEQWWEDGGKELVKQTQ